MINATNTSPQREIIPIGNYVAICYSMIEIGTIKETIKGDEKILTKVRIGWELPTECRVFKEEDGEQPFVISQEYTLSMAEKANLRKDLKSWRGKDFTDEEAKCFDITVLLGKPCMLNIIHKPSKDGSKIYNVISGITAVPKGLSVPALSNPVFCLSYDKFSETQFNTLPDFIKDKMKGSLEFIKISNPNDITNHNNYPESHENVNDDLPF